MLLLQYIKEIAKESKKKRDYIACMIIVMLSIVIGMMIHFLKPITNNFFTFVKDTSYYIVNGIDYNNSLLNMQAEFQKNIQQIIMYQDKLIAQVLCYSLMIIVPSFLCFYFLKIKRVYLILITIILELTISMIMFKEVALFIILMIIILLMMQRFIPLGSGLYYNVMLYTFYVLDVYKNKERKKTSVINIIMKAIFLFVLGVLFAMLLNSILPYLSVKVSFLLFIALVILVWMNQSPDLTIKIIRKIISYSIIIVVVLVDNNSFEINGLSPVLALVSIFFAVERVVTLTKELAKRVENESLLFLIDEISDYEVLLKQRLEIPMEMIEKVSEDVLIRQIVINKKLGCFDKAVELIDIYMLQNFEKEFYIIQGIKYEILFEKGMLSIEEAELMLEEIFSRENKGLVYWLLNYEYAYILYLKDKDYGKIIDLLEANWLLSDDKIKYILYRALIKQGKNKGAEKVKREINKFKEVKRKVEKEKKELLVNKVVIDEK